MSEFDIAVIGISCEFPGAKNKEEFWHNLCHGVNAISDISNEELLKSGISKNKIFKENYIKKGGLLTDIDKMDASFFGLSPKEVEHMDPQHRLSLIHAYLACNDANIDPFSTKLNIGVYAGCSLNTYGIYELGLTPEQFEGPFGQYTLFGNTPDYLATRIAYHLNLKGPAVSIQTACSTSLSALSLAYQSLINFQADVMLVGAATVKVPHAAGYIYEHDHVFSKNGEVRAFDRDSSGTVFSNGVGFVVLKRLEDAIADQDKIYSVIKSCAINNDGHDKSSYTSPSIQGQSDVIAFALYQANLSADDLTFIETHGTGTQVGDPIEFKGLSLVSETFNAQRKCLLGTLKSNIGHLDAAAGIASLIKASLALENRLLPKNINYVAPNSEIDLINSRFLIPTDNTVFSEDETLYAGVSCFGIGGTNTFAILSSAPKISTIKSNNPEINAPTLVTLSAKSRFSLTCYKRKLSQFINSDPNLNLNDIAYTLNMSKSVFNVRHTMLVSSLSELSEKCISEFEKDSTAKYAQLPLIYLFSGQGSQSVQMGLELYKNYSSFKNEFDFCAQLFKKAIGIDLVELIYQEHSIADWINETFLTQPMLFAVEVSLAKLLTELGLNPTVCIGHSLGEYSALVVAGVLSLEDTIAILSQRALLMQSLPKGAMLSVNLDAQKVQEILPENLDLAVINAPDLCVVSGTFEAIDALANILNHNKVTNRKLNVSHAFHSRSFDSILKEFEIYCSRFSFKPLQIEFVSNLDGRLYHIGSSPINAKYLAEHLRSTVQFSKGMKTLLSIENAVFLEIGPGQTLFTLAKKHGAKNTFRSMSLPMLKEHDSAVLLNNLGEMWKLGVFERLNWGVFHPNASKIRLPGYHFELTSYWKKNEFTPHNKLVDDSKNEKKYDIEKWFYAPSWKRTYKTFVNLEPHNVILVASTQSQITLQVSNQLRQFGHETFFFESSTDWESVLSLHVQKFLLKPLKVIYFQSDFVEPSVFDIDKFTDYQKENLLNLVKISKLLSRDLKSESFTLHIVTSGLFNVTGNECSNPSVSTLLSIKYVLPKEYRNIKAQVIDFNQSNNFELIAKQILNELDATDDLNDICYRGINRYIRHYEPLEIKKQNTVQLSQDDVIFITGGFGDLAIDLVEYYAQCGIKKIALMGRSYFPQPDDWESFISKNSEAYITEKVKRLFEVYKKGVSLKVMSCDVSVSHELCSKISEIEKEFGSITAVIHTAGVAQNGVVELKTDDAILSSFAAKVFGTYNLYQAFKKHKLKFMMLCSSMNAIVGGLGQFENTASNCFIDAFSEYINSVDNSCNIFSINWGAVNESRPAKVNVLDQFLNLSTEHKKNRMKDEEIHQIYNIIFSRFISPRLVLSTIEFETVLKNWHKVASIEALDTTVKTTKKSQTESIVEPNTEYESILVKIWKDVLGFEHISITDNFFDLGGHSLAAIQCINRLSDTLGIKTHVMNIYECPVLKDFSVLVAKLHEKQTGNYKI